jgi:hypothetical protein
MRDKALESELYYYQIQACTRFCLTYGGSLTYNIKIVPILHEVVILQEM